MPAYRALMIALAVFALAMAALGLAAATLWVRCGAGSGCSDDLALSIFAWAPAALLLVVILVFLRQDASSRFVQRALLSIATAVAALPLTVFLLRGATTIAIVSILFAALVLLAVSDRKTPQGPRESGEDSVSDADWRSERAAQHAWQEARQIFLLQERLHSLAYRLGDLRHQLEAIDVEREFRSREKIASDTVDWESTAKLAARADVSDRRHSHGDCSVSRDGGRRPSV